MRTYGALVGLGLLLLLIVWAVGGKEAVLGGALALVAQVAAVALLRPAMDAPQPAFMARWLGGMGIRALALGALLVLVATQRGVTVTLAGMLLGFLGVMLPLLFLEIRFLK